MRCVVTGAAGFVGSSIVDRLLADGNEVVGIDCFIDYYPRARKELNLIQAKQNSKFQFREASLLQLNLEEVFEGADFIFHQAAQAGVRSSWGDDFTIYTDNNILASQRVLEAAKSERVRSTLKKIVYASSSSVYGHAEALPTTEDLRPQPISPYGVSKLAAEHLMVLYSKEFSVPTVSLRYFTVYGPRQRPDMAFHRFIRAGLLNEPIHVFDDGEQSRDFSFIGDIVNANLASANAACEDLVYNVGGGSRVTVNQVLAQIQDILGKKLNIQYSKRVAGDARHTSADTLRAQRAFQYKPQVDLRAGLKLEAAWLEKEIQST